MDSAAAGLIGMGCAAAGFAGAGVGIGYIFGKMIEVVARQPEAEARVTKYMWIGFALVEAIALYGLVIAFINMGLRKKDAENGLQLCSQSLELFKVLRTYALEFLRDTVLLEGPIEHPLKRREIHHAAV